MRFITTAPFLLLSLSFCTPALAQTPDWYDVQSVARAALDANPVIQRIDAEARAARERVTQAGSYPNPMVMGGIQNLEVDIGNDEMMTMYMVGISQTIPRGSRRRALRTAADAEVRRIELEGEIIRAEVERDAIFAWYDIAGADSRLEALREVETALDAVVNAARARYEIGTTIQADIVRAQLQRSEVQHQILTEAGRRRAAVSRLLPLLGLPLATSVPSIAVPHATGRQDIDGPLEIPDSHPALVALETEVELRNQEIRLAELQTRPDFTVEASYGLRPSQTDMFSVLARVELPLRRKTLIDPRTRETAALRDAAERRIEEVRRALLADLGAAWESHAIATEQLIFHEQILVPQAALAVESTLAAYEAGLTNLDSVLAAEAASIRLGPEYYDFLVAHIKAIVDFKAIRAGARGGMTSTGVGTSSSPAPATAQTNMGMR